MKTFMAKPSTVERKWYVVDATDMTLGRLASQVAAVLRGKNKAIFTPHVDTGDHVIVINCDKVVLTDIMGAQLEIEGKVTFVDLTGGVVVIATDAA